MKLRERFMQFNLGPELDRAKRAMARGDVIFVWTDKVSALTNADEKISRHANFMLPRLAEMGWRFESSTQYTAGAESFGMYADTDLNIQYSFTNTRQS